MRIKEEILDSVKSQDVTNENHEQYTTRVLKTALEVLVDIRNLLAMDAKIKKDQKHE